MSKGKFAERYIFIYSTPGFNMAITMKILLYLILIFDSNLIINIILNLIKLK